MGIIHSESEDLGIKGPQCESLCEAESPKTRSQRTKRQSQGQKMDISAQEKSNLIWSSPSFFLFRPSMDWMVSSHRGKGNLLTQSTDLNAHLIQKHLEDTLTNNVFLASLSYLGSCRLTPKINHHLRLSLLVMVLSMTSTPAKENIPTHGL